ncbi:peptidylprolyl isomerase [Marinimicrobium sp. C2-29]
MLLRFCLTALLSLTSLTALPLQAQDEGNPRVKLDTDEGEIVLELFAEKAPKTVENFLRYVDDRFYDGTIFHRVIPGFVVQGGGMTYDFSKKDTRDPVANESDNGLSNKPMTVAMARKSDPDSANSQFFINLNNNSSLDASDDKPGYTVFGRVVSGQETIVAIVEEPTGNYDDYPNAPNTPVRILSARRVTDTGDNGSSHGDQSE